MSPEEGRVWELSAISSRQERGREEAISGGKVEPESITCDCPALLYTSRGSCGSMLCMHPCGIVIITAITPKVKSATLVILKSICYLHFSHFMCLSLFVICLWVCLHTFQISN